MDTKWGERLAEGSAARNTADYAAFYRASANEAHNRCADAAELLKDTREYLVRKGVGDLAEVPEIPGTKTGDARWRPRVHKPRKPGPKVKAPPTGGQQERNRHHK